MSSARTLSGAVLAACLVAGLAGCGGQADKDKAAETPQTPLLPASAPPSSAKPTPKPVDPTTAAKAKIMADYKTYVGWRSAGVVSNRPSYPFEQYMTGNSLQVVKSLMGGMYLIGTKYGGSMTFVKGRVAAVNLKAKPATATVYGCVIDDLTATNKQGKVRRSGGSQMSTRDQLVLVGGRWKVTETQTNTPESPGCA
ncbi:hypothetical protein PWY87_35755 [Kribbella solani]|uniref:hypothetical protein n=1 Tax=Kribbella solani TaxID=236067 RepID=UPI0029AF1C25|nr:hypothetical protein [Kribbella solani]MDX3007073.1 hypothetical protein [Kribbella solani]